MPKEFRRPRREGTVTVRATGKTAGGVYIYRADVPASLVHSVVGQVMQGIELVKLAKEHDVFAVSVEPKRIDLLGVAFAKAQEITTARGVAFTSDRQDAGRIIVSQEPGTTLDVLAEKAVKVTTAPLEKVINIALDDNAAPASCDVFRRVTGLIQHDAGVMPVFFKFDDVVLFKPEIPAGLKINPENMPVDEARLPHSRSPMTPARERGWWGYASRPARSSAPHQNPSRGPTSSGA